MTDNPEHFRRIEQINYLLTETNLPVPIVNGGLQQEIGAINATETLSAKPEYEHRSVGHGYQWQPKYLPDFIRCFPDVNEVLSEEIGIHTPFRKEGAPAALSGIRLVQAAGVWCARYDLVPEGSGLIVSVLYFRETLARAGKSVLELSVRKK